MNPIGLSNISGNSPVQVDYPNNKEFSPSLEDTGRNKLVFSESCRELVSDGIQEIPDVELSRTDPLGCLVNDLLDYSAPPEPMFAD